MAQLKDTIVSGNLRVTDTTLTDTLQVTTIKAPTSSGGTTYGPGTSGQVLKSNGTTTYWGDDNNSSTVLQSSTTTSNFRPLVFGTKDTTTISSLADTVTGQLYTSTRLFFQPSSGNLYMYSPSGDSPALIFQRGTFIDGSLDWKMYDTGGALRFAQAGRNTSTESWVTVVEHKTTTNTASTPAIRSMLGVYGTTYGNTAANMLGGTAGVFQYGDGGPQIDFATAPGAAQSGALIFTDNDTAATGASWHFVSTESDWNVTSKRFHAKSSISIGTDTPNTSYNLYVYGTTNITGNTTIGGTLGVTGAITQNGNQVLHAGNYTSYTYSSTASRTANYVLAAPNGSAGAATFRKLVAADLPSHTHAYTVPPSVFAVQTGSTKQSHITLETLMTWLISTKAYITLGANRSLTLCTTWSYSDNDILQLSINGTNYELQLAGVIIEFDGAATSYNAGVFRLRIHSSPTLSFTPASGYTQFPASHIAEYTCNGSGYSPTWKMIIDRADISNGTSTTGNGTISVAGKAVSVYGLGSAAYTASTAYLPSTTTYALSTSVGGNAVLADGLAMKTLTAETLDTTTGSFVFKGDQLLGGTYDWVGLQVDGSNDAFQLMANGQLMIRQNDETSKTSANWGAWKGCLTPSNVSGSGGITVTQNDITIGSGETAFTYKGAVTISHTNSIAAQSSIAFKKFSYDANGHITETANVVKADITALGIPAQDTKYGISGAYGANSDTWVTTITAGGTGTTSTVPTASTSAYGITKLYNGVDSTSTALAATANAVKTAYDKANHSHPYLPLAGGTLTGRVTTAKFLNYIVKGTGTAGADKGSGQNPRYVPAKWTFDTGQTASDGDIIFIKIPVAGHDYGVYISINNGTSYHPAVISGSSRLTTHYGNGNYAAFTFRSDGSAASMIPLAGNTDGTRVTVTGGVWQGIDYYDSGNTYDRTSMQTRIYAGGVGVFRYSICAMNNAQRMESFTTTGDANGSPTTTKTFNTSAKFAYPPVIMYNSANAVYSSGSVIGNNVLYEQYPSIDMRYSCNKTSSSGFAQYKPIFIECTFDANGYFSITSNGFVQTFTDGKYYILVGCMYSTSVYQLALFAQHPLYYYDGTNLRYMPAPHTHSEYLPLAGGTMTGPLTMKANQYSGTYGLDMNNSDIVGANRIVFADLADSYTEGLAFYRTTTDNVKIYDNFWIKEGVMYFTPNAPTATTNNVVLHTGNLSTYVKASSNNGKISVNGSDVTVYTHPTATSQPSGLYKITVNGTGHVTTATAAGPYAGSSSDGGAATSANTLALKSLAFGSTLDTTTGLFAYTTTGSIYGTNSADWVGMQIGSSSDRFQIMGSVGSTVLIRTNDNSDGTISSGWSKWTALMTPASIVAGSGLTKTYGYFDGTADSDIIINATIGHSNSITAQTSTVFKKFAYDACGHITDTADVSASDLPSHTHNYVPNTQAGVNAAINLLGTGSSTPVDGDYYISQYVGGGTTTTTYHRRPMSALASYVRTKLSVTSSGSGPVVTGMSYSSSTGVLTYTKGRVLSTSGGQWIAGRDNAPLYANSGSSTSGNFFPAIAVKTNAGAWSIGALGSGDSLAFSFSTDTNYSGGTNTTNNYYIGTDGAFTGTAAGLTTKAVTASTIDTTPGSFVFGGTNIIGGINDWVGFQADAGNDRFQIIAKSQLVFRQNDNATIEGEWDPWIGCLTPNNVSGDSGITITNITTTIGTGTTALTYNSGVKISHTNSITASTSEVFKKFSYDANGHITGTANVGASDIPALNYVKTAPSVNYNINQAGFYAVMANKNTDNPNIDLPTDNQWWHVLSMSWAGTSSDVNSWISQLAIPTYQNKLNGLYWRTNSASNTALSAADWKRVYCEEKLTPSTTTKTRNILHIYGSTVGNTASELVGGVKGVLSYGDAGPQINFSTAATIGSAQDSAIIWTDNDSAATGVSWHFVSNQSDWNVISKRFHARTGISIGTDLPNTTYNLYVNGTTYHSDAITFGTTSAVVTPALNVYTRSSSTYSTLVKWSNGSTWGTRGAEIGYHNTGGDSTNPGTICILPYQTESNPWDGQVGLFIKKDHVYIDGVELSKTDENVKQTATTTNADYEVLFSATADNTTRTEAARKNSNLKFNPSTGMLTTTTIKGGLYSYNPASDQTLSNAYPTYTVAYFVTAGAYGGSTGRTGNSGSNYWAHYLTFTHSDRNYRYLLRFPYWGPPQYQHTNDGGNKRWYSFITDEHAGNYSKYMGTGTPIDPITGAMHCTHRANKLAFLPAANITVQTSTDSGSTWTNLSVSDDLKRKIFSLPVRNSNINIGPSSGNTSTSMQTRIIIECDGRDAVLNRFMFEIGSNHQNIAIDVYAGTTIAGLTKIATGDSSSTWAYEAVVTIDHNPDKYYRFSTSNYKYIAFVFRYTYVDSSYPTERGTINGISGYSGNYWGNNCKSNLAHFDHLYSWDIDQNALFPATVQGEKLAVKSGTYTTTIEKGTTTADRTLVLPDTSGGIGIANILLSDPTNSTNPVSVSGSLSDYDYFTIVISLNGANSDQSSSTIVPAIAGSHYFLFQILESVGSGGSMIFPAGVMITTTSSSISFSVGVNRGINIPSSGTATSIATPRTAYIKMIIGHKS